MEEEGVVEERGRGRRGGQSGMRGQGGREVGGEDPTGATMTVTTINEVLLIIIIK